MTSLPRIWTAEEVSDYLKIETDSVNQEFEDGKLQGFFIGQEWRCTEDHLWNYITKGSDNRLRKGVRQSTRTDTGEGTFSEISPFTYRWPKKKDAPIEDAEEYYEEAHETTRNVNGRSAVFTIGFADREIGGEKRRRVTVWLDQSRPLVEFAGSHDYASSGLLASVIKLPDNKQLRTNQEVPPEYKDFQIATYDSVVQVYRASRNMAIVVHRSDLESMIRHAIIRARWKGYL